MSSRSFVVLALVLLALSAWPRSRGHASPLSAKTLSVVQSAARSHSVGYPWKGRLEGGVRLQESELLRYVGEYREEDNFFGTRELVSALERAAAHVAKLHPGAKLSVGELSDETGGRLPEHHSHQSGRDVDVAFYGRMAETGEPVEPETFIRYWATGIGEGRDRDKRFDDARNWALVESLLTDSQVRVQFVFVAMTLRRRLLRQGFRAGGSRELLARAATVLRTPSGRHPHKNHFHVRVYCPVADRPDCRERGPFWEWYEGRAPWGLVHPTRHPPWWREWHMPR